MRITLLLTGLAAGYLSSSHGLALLPAGPGMFSRHMLSHILLMNVAAPALAALLYSGTAAHNRSCRGVVLAGAASLQLVLLVGWHAPPVLVTAMGDPRLAVLMQASLFGSAFWFWYCVYQQVESDVWRALAALLVTGKLYCLMAALLVFAPRVLYPGSATVAPISLSDQQLAGVLMVVACPLSYVVIATVLAARWLAALHSRNSGAHAPQVVAAPEWN